MEHLQSLEDFTPGDVETIITEYLSVNGRHPDMKVIAQFDRSAQPQLEAAVLEGIGWDSVEDLPAPVHEADGFTMQCIGEYRNERYSYELRRTCVDTGDGVDEQLITYYLARNPNDFAST